MSEPLVRLTEVYRSFGAVPALAGADLELWRGEVHGVLGANGAGKSTLFNVLGGLLVPDRGRVSIRGRDVSLRSPRDAWEHGIGLVHQHFTLVPALTVAENLALGIRGTSRQQISDLARATMDRTGLHVPMDALVSEIGVGDRQRTEILKALLRDPGILVLDEPTAVLTPGEVDGLFDLLTSLAEDGRAVALVAHKLDEVLSVSQRVTVLRDGRTVLSADRSQVESQDLVSAMVGDGVADEIALGVHELGSRERAVASSEVARAPVGGLADVSGDRLDAVSLSVGAGEIVGVAGVEGNGQHELALLLSGRITPRSGRVDVPDEVAFIPQDRRKEGLIADFDLTENTALALSRLSAFDSGPFMPWEALRVEADRARTHFGVDAPSVDTLAGTLSGGNQQRVIVGRELALGAPMLVAENPTRGLDVAAAAFVHGELKRLAEDGLAIVLISTDLDEVLALSDRLLVMSRGRCFDVPFDSWTREGVGALMLAAAGPDS